MTDPSQVAIRRTYTKRSDKDEHYTGAIAQYAVENESLTGLRANKILVRNIRFTAKENLSFRLIFWGKDTYQDTADLDLDPFLGAVDLDLPARGFRVAAANQYYLDIRGVDLHYADWDGTKELHLSLQNLSAASKSAGAAGEVVVEVEYEVVD